MTRDEHLAWCKAQAYELVEQGELAKAVASMVSNLSKHRQTKPRLILIQLGMMYLADMDQRAIERWIEGFR
jgi:hypothetical protein